MHLLLKVSFNCFLKSKIEFCYFDCRFNLKLAAAIYWWYNNNNNNHEDDNDVLNSYVHCSIVMLCSMATVALPPLALLFLVIAAALVNVTVWPYCIE